jgi:hypothetical protein
MGREVGDQRRIAGDLFSYISQKLLFLRTLFMNGDSARKKFSGQQVLQVLFSRALCNRGIALRNSAKQ